jgi:acyl carrier protein
MTPMTSPGRITVEVEEIVRKRTARVWTGDPAEQHLPLGGDGLGLDSIALAEVLLECEEQFGISAMSLLNGETLTMARLVAHVRGARAA